MAICVDVIGMLNGRALSPQQASELQEMRSQMIEMSGKLQVSSPHLWYAVYGENIESIDCKLLAIINGNRGANL